jgi:hypothetical protein
MGWGWLSYLLCAASVLSEAPLGRLSTEESVAICSTEIDRILSKWAVNQHPSFLQATYIAPAAWKEMKDKIVDHLTTPQSTFVMSFMGAGSTVGYDVSREQVFSELLAHTLRPIFRSLGIGFEIRNVGIGSNLCTPYGLCVNTFAGVDADLILWEHTFDCGFPECGFILEQFVRQALSSPTRPIVSFGSSLFPNWSVSLPFPPSLYLTLYSLSVSLYLCLHL